MEYATAAATIVDGEVSNQKQFLPFQPQHYSSLEPLVRDRHQSISSRGAAHISHSNLLGSSI